MLIFVKTINRILILPLVILAMVLLISCGSFTSAPTATATTMPTSTFVIPANTELPPTLSSTSTPTSNPISPAPDGLHMAYIVDDNLYYQNGSNPPLQLTHSGEDRRPISFSEDGKRVFFTRGAQEIYSINVDGSQEQALVTNDVLLTFGADYYDETTTPCDPVLAPHTHLLLFRTCSHPDEYTILYHDDLFVVDTINGQVKNIFPRNQGGNFYVSPDGSMLAIDRLNSIDIVSIDGKVVHRKLATYSRSEPIPLGSLIYWFSDSNGLVVALPINTFYDTSQPPMYTIWRFSLDTGLGVQINLNPPPMSNEPIWVSSDGNWITYNNYFEHSFYLGDLRKGEAQPNEVALPYSWSLDNIHFVYAVPQPSGSDLYLASVNSPSVFIGKGAFVGWLDSNRYIYFSNQMFIMGEIDKEPIPILVGSTQPFIQSDFGTLIFSFQP